MGIPSITGYKIKRQIGFGGMADVYLAEQESLQRQVALKVIYSHFADREDHRQRFLLDGRSAARLSHRRIVSVYDMGMVDDQCYIAMEYLPGGTLQERIKRGLSPQQSLEIVKHMAEALAYAHQHGFVHRDIKPMNILFRGDGYPVLTDFGIAKDHITANTALTMTGTVLGSPKYMSPEQARGEEVDGRSDIYSLGIVLFEMLAGTAPYDSTTSAIDIVMKHLNNPVPSLPPELREYQFLVCKMMAKEPTNRPQSAEELIEIVSSLIDGKNKATAGSKTQLLAHSDYYRKNKKRKAFFTVKRALVSALLASLPIVGASGLLKENWNIEKFTQFLESSDQRSEANPSKTYTQNLAIPPKPQVAVNAPMVKKLTAAHYQAASEAIRYKNPRRALTYVNEGLQDYPDHAGLLNLKIALIREEDIKKLLHKAKRQQAQGQFTDPPDNNALQTYQRLLTLDPNNAEATRAVKAIAAYHRQHAVEEYNQHNYEKCLAMIEIGLRAQPGHKALLQLKVAAEQKLTMEQKKSNSLLAQAEQLLTIYPLTEVELRRASEKYQAALEHHGDSERTKSGMAKIATAYYKLAEQSLTERNLNQSLSYIRKGQQADPANNDLNMLGKKVVDMLQEHPKSGDITVAQDL